MHAFDDDMKLGVDKSEEALENGRGLVFVAQGKCPGVMGVIFEDNQIVLKAGETYKRDVHKSQCIKSNATYVLLEEEEKGRCG